MSADLLVKPTISPDGRYLSLMVECHDTFKVAYQLDSGRFLAGRQVGLGSSGYRLNTGMMPREMSVKLTTQDGLAVMIKRYADSEGNLSTSFDVLFVHHDPFNIVESGTFMVWPASFYGADYRQDLVMWRGLTVCVKGQGFDQNVIVK